MKKLIAGIFLAMVPFFGFSQSIFDRFEDSERIGSVTISKGMLNIFAEAMSDNEDEESREFAEMAKSIDGIKVFVSEDEGAAADMMATMKRYVKSSRLEELMKIKDGDTNLKFYIKNGKDENHVQELLMFVTGLDDGKEEKYGIETVLLTMSGDIDLTKVGSLTNKMNLPKELKEVERN